MTPINLMPHDRQIRQLTRRRTGVWLRFLRIYGIALAVASGAVMLPAHAGSPAPETMAARLDDQIQKLEKKLDLDKKEAARLAVRLETSRFVGEHPDWSLVMEAVSRARSSVEADPASGVSAPVTSIALESFELITTKQEAKPAKGAATAGAAASKAGLTREMHAIRIAGYATSTSSALQFVRRLERMEVAESVTLKETRSQTLGKALLTHFDIEMSIPGDRASPASASGGTK